MRIISDFIRDYAAALATAVKKWCWDFASRVKPEKFPLFGSSLFCMYGQPIFYFQGLCPRTPGVYRFSGFRLGKDEAGRRPSPSPEM